MAQPYSGAKRRRYESSLDVSDGPNKTSLAFQSSSSSDHFDPGFPSHLSGNEFSGMGMDTPFKDFAIRDVMLPMLEQSDDYGLSSTSLNFGVEPMMLDDNPSPLHPCTQTFESNAKVNQPESVGKKESVPVQTAIEPSLELKSESATSVSAASVSGTRHLTPERIALISSLFTQESSKRPAPHILDCALHSHDVSQMFEGNHIACSCGALKDSWLTSDTTKVATTLQCPFGDSKPRKTQKNRALSLAIGPISFKIPYIVWSKSTCRKRKGFSFSKENNTLCVLADEFFLPLTSEVAIVFQVKPNFCFQKGGVAACDYPLMFLSAVDNAHRIVLTKELMLAQAYLFTLVLRLPDPCAKLPSIQVGDNPLFQGLLNYALSSHINHRDEETKLGSASHSPTLSAASSASISSASYSSTPSSCFRSSSFSSTTPTMPPIQMLDVGSQGVRVHRGSSDSSHSVASLSSVSSFNSLTSCEPFSPGFSDMSTPSTSHTPNGASYHTSWTDQKIHDSSPSLADGQLSFLARQQQLELQQRQLQQQAELLRQQQMQMERQRQELALRQLQLQSLQQPPCQQASNSMLHPIPEGSPLIQVSSPHQPVSYGIHPSHTDRHVNLRIPLILTRQQQVIGQLPASEALALHSILLAVPPHGGGRWCPQIEISASEISSFADPTSLEIVLPNAPERWINVANFMETTTLPVDLNVRFMLSENKHSDANYTHSSPQLFVIKEGFFQYQINNTSMKTGGNISGSMNTGSRSDDGPFGSNGGGGGDSSGNDDQLIGHLAQMVEQHLMFLEKNGHTSGDGGGCLNFTNFVSQEEQAESIMTRDGTKQRGEQKRNVIQRLARTLIRQFTSNSTSSQNASEMVAQSSIMSALWTKAHALVKLYQEQQKQQQTSESEASVECQFGGTDSSEETEDKTLSRQSSFRSFTDEEYLQTMPLHSPVHSACSSTEFCPETSFSQTSSSSILDDHEDDPFNSQTQSEGSDTLSIKLGSWYDSEEPMNPLNRVDRHGYTLLHYATYCNSKRLSRYLLRNGADVFVQDSRRKLTAIQLADLVHPRSSSSERPSDNRDEMSPQSSNDGALDAIDSSASELSTTTDTDHEIYIANSNEEMDAQASDRSSRKRHFGSARTIHGLLRHYALQANELNRPSSSIGIPLSTDNTNPDHEEYLSSFSRVSSDADIADDEYDSVRTSLMSTASTSSIAIPSCSSRTSDPGFSGSPDKSQNPLDESDIVYEADTSAHNERLLNPFIDDPTDNQLDPILPVKKSTSSSLSSSMNCLQVRCCHWWTNLSVKQKVFVSFLVMTVLAGLLIGLFMLVAMRILAENAVRSTSFYMDRVDLSGPSAMTGSDITIRFQGGIENSGPWGGTIDPALIEVVHNDEIVGMVNFPKLFMPKNQYTSFDIPVTMTQTNIAGFTQDMLSKNQFEFNFRSRSGVTFNLHAFEHSFSFDRVPFAKSVSLLGMAGLRNSTYANLVLYQNLEDSIASDSILAKSTSASLSSPSTTSFPTSDRLKDDQSVDKIVPSLPSGEHGAFSRRLLTQRLFPKKSNKPNLLEGGANEQQLSQSLVPFSLSFQFINPANVGMYLGDTKFTIRSPISRGDMDSLVSNKMGENKRKESKTNALSALLSKLTRGSQLIDAGAISSRTNPVKDPKSFVTIAHARIWNATIVPGFNNFTIEGEIYTEGVSKETCLVLLQRWLAGEASVLQIDMSSTITHKDLHHELSSSASAVSGSSSRRASSLKNIFLDVIMHGSNSFVLSEPLQVAETMVSVTSSSAVSDRSNVRDEDTGEHIDSSSSSSKVKKVFNKVFKKFVNLFKRKDTSTSNDLGSPVSPHINDISLATTSKQFRFNSHLGGEQLVSVRSVDAVNLTLYIASPSPNGGDGGGDWDSVTFDKHGHVQTANIVNGRVQAVGQFVANTVVSPSLLSISTQRLIGDLDDVKAAEEQLADETEDSFVSSVADRAGPVMIDLLGALIVNVSRQTLDPSEVPTSSTSSVSFQRLMHQLMATRPQSSTKLWVQGIVNATILTPFGISESEIALSEWLLLPGLDLHDSVGTSSYNRNESDNDSDYISDHQNGILDTMVSDPDFASEGVALRIDNFRLSSTQSVSERLDMDVYFTAELIINNPTHYAFDLAEFVQLDSKFWLYNKEFQEKIGFIQVHEKQTSSSSSWISARASSTIIIKGLLTDQNARVQQMLRDYWVAKPFVLHLSLLDDPTSPASWRDSFLRDNVANPSVDSTSLYEVLCSPDPYSRLAKNFSFHMQIIDSHSLSTSTALDELVNEQNRDVDTKFTHDWIMAHRSPYWSADFVLKPKVGSVEGPVEVNQEPRGESLASSSVPQFSPSFLQTTWAKHSPGYENRRKSDRAEIQNRDFESFDQDFGSIEWQSTVNLYLSANSCRASLRDMDIDGVAAILDHDTYYKIGEAGVVSYGFSSTTGKAYYRLEGLSSLFSSLDPEQFDQEHSQDPFSLSLLQQCWASHLNQEIPFLPIVMDWRIQESSLFLARKTTMLLANVFPQNSILTDPDGSDMRNIHDDDGGEIESAHTFELTAEESSTNSNSRVVDSGGVVSSQDGEEPLPMPITSVSGASNVSDTVSSTSKGLFSSENKMIKQMSFRVDALEVDGDENSGISDQPLKVKLVGAFLIEFEPWMRRKTSLFATQHFSGTLSLTQNWVSFARGQEQDNIIPAKSSDSKDDKAIISVQLRHVPMHCSDDNLMCIVSLTMFSEDSQTKSESQLQQQMDIQDSSSFFNLVYSLDGDRIVQGSVLLEDSTLSGMFDPFTFPRTDRNVFSGESSKYLNQESSFGNDNAGVHSHGEWAMKMHVPIHADSLMPISILRS